MPIWLTQQIEPGLHFGIWEIEETEALLFGLIENFYTLDDLKHIHNRQKRLQWLAARVLVQQLCNQLQIDFYGTYKDEFNKVFLKNSPFEISISHTNRYAAVAIQKTKNVGIDLEEISDKPARIAPRFMSPQELDNCDKTNENYTFYWAAKEAVYKCYGKKNITFNTQIEISNLTNALLHLKGFTHEISLYAKKIESLQLVVAFLPDATIS